MITEMESFGQAQVEHPDLIPGFEQASQVLTLVPPDPAAAQVRREVKFLVDIPDSGFVGASGDPLKDHSVRLVLMLIVIRADVDLQPERSLDAHFALVPLADELGRVAPSVTSLLVRRDPDDAVPHIMVIKGHLDP